MKPGRVNDRWPLVLTDDRVSFHADRIGWEKERLASMHANLKSGDVIYDVGAECGDLPALWGTFGCEVVLIEPQPRYWPSIRAHFDANGLTPRGRYVGFCADESNEKDGFYPDLWPGCAFDEVVPDAGFLHLAQSGEDGPARTTIDELAARVGPPDAITADVEGAECRVLQGADKVLSDTRPLVWLSLHTDQAWMDENYSGEGRDAVLALLERHGYMWVQLAIDHEAHIFAYPEEREGSVVLP